MESYLQYLTEDVDADAIILAGLKQNKSGNQEIDATELKHFIHTDDHTSINSSSIIILRISHAQQQNKTKSSQTWTKNKRNTSVKNLENEGYGRRNFSKKSKEIKKYGDDFAQ